MKKSEKYHLAMIAVLNENRYLGSEDRLEIIEMLIKDKELAEFMESREVGGGE